MLKRGLCSHAVSVCLSVSVTFVNCVKTNKHIKIISLSGRSIILVFFLPNAIKILRRDPPPSIGASNAGRVGRNSDSEPISGFSACC